MSEWAELIPIRLCCGQRHLGAVCPDGLTMCCLCFEWFPLDQLHVTDDGTPEDVCLLCARNESRHGWGSR